MNLSSRAISEDEDGDWIFDMKGTHKADEKTIRGKAFMAYNCRMILKRGAKGDELWRGTEDDMPFRGFHPAFTLSKDYVSKEEAKPADERGKKVVHAVAPLKKVFNTAKDLIADKKHSKKHNRPEGPAGDEFPVAGIIQSFISKSGTHKIARMANKAAIISNTLDFKSAKKNTKTNCFEFVSGNGLLPTIYDLDVSEDNMRATGRSQCPDASWAALVDLQSSSLKYDFKDKVDFSHLRDRDSEEKENFRKAAAAIEKIRDDEKRNEIDTKQQEMVQAICTDDAEKAESIHKDLKEIAEKENARLSALIQICMQKYQTVKGRYAAVTVIEDCKSAEKSTQLDPPKTCQGAEDKVRALLGMASWRELKFRSAMREIAIDLNEACSSDSLDTFCEKYGLDPADYPFALDGSFRLPKDHDDDDSEVCVKGMFGGPKSFDRALVKTEEGKSLKDLNRASFIFEDPYVMGICFHALNSQFEIVTVKNKFRQPKEAGEDFVWDQPPCLHLNICLDDGWLVEVQLHLNDILTIKGELHYCYDITRSTSSMEIFAPLYRPDLGSNLFQ